MIAVCAQQRGYGDWLEGWDGYPTMKERRVMLLTNACRIAPREYRDRYLVPYNAQAADILTAQQYPAVAAVYWDLDLNRAARAHAQDMAQNMGLSHSSSDGTSAGERIGSFYDKDGWWGENIAAGRDDAFGTMRQWLLDITDYTNQTPAPDNSAYDGHRSNIMHAHAEEIGIGYAYGPQQYRHFWTMDLGAGTPAYDNPITAGCHFLSENGDSVVFMAVYTGSGTSEPLSAVVYVDEMAHAMSVHMGDARNGVYRASMETGDDCSAYWFAFRHESDTLYRFPVSGKLKTAGAGACSEEYASGATRKQPVRSFQYTNEGPFTVIDAGKRTIRFAYAGAAAMKGVFIMTDMQGHIVVQCEQGTMTRNGNHFVLHYDMPVTPGVYSARLTTGNGTVYAQRCVIR
jgi:hypothetical protein